MRAVLQISEKSLLTCEGEEISSCGMGLCILLGLTEGDDKAIADAMIDKILKMRIFHDENGKLNLSALQVGADVLLVSNFTLYANCASRRPDFLRAMKYAPAKELYEYVLEQTDRRAKELKAPEDRGIRVFGGVFGGDMKISLQLDGPITILLDSEKDL